MADMIGAPYPLTWPEGWPRTSYRKTSRYERAFARDRDAILRRLRGMGAVDIIISSNVPLRRDGLPMAGTSQPQDPGVAVYFQRRKREHVVACDAWKTVDENLRAVLRTLEALATIERSGSAQIEDRAFQGFARLPASAGVGVTHWSVVLGLSKAYQSSTASERHRLLPDAESQYRQLARQMHPDAPGGSHEAFVELGVAIEAARKELAARATG